VEPGFKYEGVKIFFDGDTTSHISSQDTHIKSYQYKCLALPPYKKILQIKFRMKVACKKIFIELVFLPKIIGA
jgi:formyltetrahydrofolate hydrolase